MSSVPTVVSRVAQLMRPFGGAWFLVGGWAVDAWLGRESREHLDADIGIFRDDESALFEHLPGWHLVGHDTPDAAHDEPWDGSPLRFPAHIHARHTEWPALEFMVNERSGNQWIVNQVPLLSFSLDEAIRTSGWDLPTLVPELVIWHKAKGEPRPHDELDFEVILPLLDERQRGWLARSIGQLNSEHPWLSRLRTPG